MNGTFPEGVKVTTSGNKGTNAGTYTAKAVFTLAEGYNADNYEIANGADLTAQWSIAKAKAEITVDTTPITAVYGDTVELPEATSNFGSVTCDKKAADLVNAGSYTVTYTVEETDNYDGATKTVSVTIGKRSVTITAKDQTITFGGSISTTEITSTGLVSDHSATATLTPSTSKVTTNGTITASAAVITANGIDVTANYDISYATGKLVVQPDTSKIDDLTTDNVSSADKEDIEKVQEMLDNAESIQDDWKELAKTCEELLDKIEEVAKEMQDAADNANSFDPDTVKSTEKEELDKLAEDIQNLLDSENLTEDEKKDLEEVQKQVQDMIDAIEDAAEDSKTATDTIGALTPETVTSDDKGDLEAAIETIDKLLQNEHLTDEEKKALEDIKKDAEELLNKIETVQGATDTENTEKVEDVTSGNVKPEDKDDLEKAKADLEQALKDNGGNYTEEEKKDIQDEIQRIEDAIEALEKVEDITDIITQLPGTVEPDDEKTAEKILDAKKAYDDLTDHEKSLVDDDTKKKLDDLVAALTDYEITKGNGSRWTRGSSHGLTFTANGPFSKFVGVEVDGKEVSSWYYDAESGSTIVTLKRFFLKRLSTGEHTITVLYTDGEATGTFKIVADSIIPATGDDFNLAFWNGMAMTSLLALAALVIVRKKLYQK